MSVICLVSQHNVPSPSILWIDLANISKFGSFAPLQHRLHHLCLEALDVFVFHEGYARFVRDFGYPPSRLLESA